MRQFSVFRRSATGLYYVQFRDPETGLRLGRRSLGTSDRDQALLLIAEWMRDGIPAPQEGRRSLERIFSLESVLRALHDAPLTVGDASRIVADLRARGLLDKKGNTSAEASEPFGAWLRAFWKYDSPYIRERLAHGQRATNRHCQDMEGRAREIESMLPFGLSLGEVRRSHLVELGLALKARGLAAATVNKDLSAATTALRWAAANEIIPNDPTRGLRGFSGQGKRRGILEPAEVKALFSTTWEDERARVACLVAMTTGARLGEVLALRHEDIGNDRLHIRHSYSISDKLKSTKSGEAREVPLLPTVRSALLSLEAKSPHTAAPERFIFAGRYPDRPLDANRVLLGMRKALVAMNGGAWGDDKKPTEVAAREKILAEYSARGIDFHSWRHWYAKTMSDRLDAKTVQRATGHKTAAMLEHYADHVAAEDMSRLGVAAGEAFTRLIETPAMEALA
ncbi:MAG: tyrosine-type recombinase/integrase [Rectinemataceae bacterium]